MQHSPFTSSILFMLLYAVTAIAGALIGSIFASFNFDNVIAGALCGWLAMLFAGEARVWLGNMLSKAANSQVPAPYAFTYPVRMLIGAVIALLVAYLVMVTMGIALGAVGGLIIALLTVLILSLIMVIRVSMSK